LRGDQYRPPPAALASPEAEEPDRRERAQYDLEHSALVDALKQRDPEKARRLIHQHLIRVRDSLLAIEA